MTPVSAEFAREDELVDGENDGDERQVARDERTEQEVYRTLRPDRGEPERPHEREQCRRDSREDAARDDQPVALHEKPVRRSVGPASTLALGV
ncbi:hypothetical protein [Halorussus caseinilyticus]|uniref:Uncharacterized protein n=1 Tax=Halorussus caseinilyticus TaxID=3034025 RepID=A0ABD5WJF2_9EURY|nr:hypothetical protein [Halorussus sp. DT72]